MRWMLAKNYDVSYPLAVDIESQYILDLSTQEDIANAFCRAAAEAGYTPIDSDYHVLLTEMDTNQIPRHGGQIRRPSQLSQPSHVEATIRA